MEGCGNAMEGMGREVGAGRVFTGAGVGVGLTAGGVSTTGAGTVTETGEEIGEGAGTMTPRVIFGEII